MQHGDGDFRSYHLDEHDNLDISLPTCKLKLNSIEWKNERRELLSCENHEWETGGGIVMR